MRARSLFSLRGRLCLLIALALGPALALMVYAGYRERRAALSNARNEALRHVRLAAAQYEQSVESTRHLLVALSMIPAVRDHDESCNGLLADFLTRYPLYANLGVIERDGNTVCSGLRFQDPASLADRSYFRRALETREFAIGDYQIGRITGKASVNFGYPILDRSGSPRFVIFAALDLGRFYSLGTKADLPENWALTLMDRTGTTLVRYPGDAGRTGTPAPESAILNLSDVRQGDGTVEADLNGIPSLIALNDMGGSTDPGGLYITVSLPKAQVLANTNQIFSRSLLALGLVGLGALGIAWIGGRRFVLQPVTLLLGTAERLAAGDLSARSALIDENSELGQFARVFDKMAASLEEQQRRLEKANRALQTLSECNQTLIRATEEGGFAREICRIIVERGGYRFAWVGMAEDNEAKTIRPIAQWGDENGYLDALEMSWAETAQDQAPAGKAIRTGQSFVMGDVQRGPASGPWHQEAKRRGFGSVLSLPLIASGQVLGSLSIYATEPDAFTPEEQRLFMELSSDLAYGLSTVQTRLARREAEESLRERERTLSTLMRNLPGMAYRCRNDLHWTMEFVSDGCFPLTGYGARDLIRNQRVAYGDLIHPEDRRQIWDEVQQALASDLPYQLTYRITTAQGDEKWLWEQGCGVHSPDGSLLALEGFITDITAGKRAEENTRKNLQCIRALHEIDLAIGSTLDLRSVLEVLLEKIELFVPYASASAIRLLNGKTTTLEPVASRNLEAKAWRTEKSGAPAGLAQLVLESKSPVAVIDALRDRRVRDPIFFRENGLVSYLGVPLGSKGKALGVLSFYTKEEHEFSGEEIEFLGTLAAQASIAIHNSQLYEETKAQALALERSNKMKDQFLAVMSHELRTPLTSAMGYMGLIQEGFLGEINPKQQEGLQKVLHHCNELLTLVNNVLQATGLYGRTVGLQIHEVDVVELLDKLRESYQPPSGKRLDLAWDYLPDLPKVTTDGEKVSQILQNLVDNAVKFTEEGAVNVSARWVAEKETLEFAVRDTGIGIPAELRSRIFELFSQADSSDTRKHGGMGLGLYITNELAVLLGCDLKVQSEPGKGSTFTVTLPCTAASRVGGLAKINRSS